MIIEPTQITQDGVTFNQLTYAGQFWAVGYDDSLNIQLYTKETEPLEAGTKVNGQLNGFGATTYTELIAEISNRGLIWPTV